jgi:omega-amidase
MLRIGLIQMLVEDSKDNNLSKAEKMIKKAVNKGAKIVVLPEMFNCPYDTSFFRSYAEEEGGHTFSRLSKIAKDEGIILIGGSIPEIESTTDRVYNTCYVFDSTGSKIGKHRKMHLFDIDVEGGQYFKESDILSPGKSVTVFDTPYGKMGVAICFDFRFPELSRLMAYEGAKIIFMPGAFNMTTGPAHWEILFKSRALDNQVYTVGVAPARSYDGSYISYGNSMIVDPWGKVVGRLDYEENILIEDIDLDIIEKIRKELPLLSSIRHDVYELKKKNI